MTTNITNCDLEPIHRLGYLQPHGYLLAIEVKSQKTAYISENSGEILGVEAKVLLDLSISDLINKLSATEPGEKVAALIQKALGLKKSHNSEVEIVELNGREFYALSHFHNGLIILEFEPKIIKQDIFSTIYNINAVLLSAEDLTTLLQSAAEEVRKLIDYDRVLMYQFLRDESGLVLAESSREDDKIYLGLRFPESDIPKQARMLYTKNKVRIINNSLAKDVAILSKNSEPIDLTHAVLRSVSPMHIQYLANMGVVSSFSISIVYEGRLWGLIACHNSVPKPVDYQIRSAGKLFADLIGQFVKNDSEKKQANHRVEINQKTERFVQQLSNSDLLSGALLKNEYTLLDFIAADGGATFISGSLTTKGTVPDTELIHKIIQLCRQQNSSWETDSLSAFFPEFKEKLNGISGALIRKIGTDGDNVLMWFRKEYYHEIKWAGEPVKVFKDVKIDGIEFQQINPRKSFETWNQSVKDVSRPWTNSELLSAEILADHLYQITFRRNRLLERSNRELQVAYSEMDNFMHSVSHDINNPLTSIKLNSELLLRKIEDDKIKDRLRAISNQADKISQMLNQFRELSKISGGESLKEVIEMPGMITGILEELVIRYSALNTKLEIGDLHNISGNEIAIYQIFANILGNAVKYSARNESPLVKIESALSERVVKYRIFDNGIGISPDTADIFEAFERADSAKEFEGSGIGLSIVKNLMMRQNATIHYISCIDGGTSFYLEFPNPMDRLGNI